MAINTTLDEHKLLMSADSDFGKFGKTDKKCPRCGGNIICEEKGSSYRIRCESSECIFADIRGI